MKIFITLLVSLFIISCGKNSTTLPSTDEEGETGEDTDMSVIFSTVSPTSGLVSGGTTVNINGSNFTIGTTVLFGAAACSNINIISTSQLTCVTPANSEGSVSITLLNPDQTFATQSSAFIYGSVPTTFSSVNPTSYINSQPVTITIDGSGFVSGMTVNIGGSPCTSVFIVSASQLRCSTPIGLTAGSYDIVITSPTTDTATGTSVFSFRLAPTLATLKGSTAQGAFQTCLGCHGTRGGLDLADFSSLSQRVVAGDLNGSLMLQRMLGNGAIMPPAGMRPSSEIQALSDWILDGAQNN